LGAKSTSKNVTKAYLNTQKTANNNNKVNTVRFQNTVCTPFHIVPEQCSKCSRTVNGAACRTPGARVKMFGTIAEYPATYISTV
jgi:hypothetical protein